jgi:transcriptional regulator with XRE-family HTH domain
MTGKELQKFREAFGLSRRELAEKLGVTRMTIWRGEKIHPSRLLQSLLDQALARGQLQIPTDEEKKSP